MDWDELEPKAKKPAPKDLEPLGVEALEDYIAELEAEIARVRQAIAKKSTARSAAEGFFRKT